MAGIAVIVIKSHRRARDAAASSNKRIGLRYIIVWNNVATNFGQFLSLRVAVSIPRYGTAHAIVHALVGGHANREE